MGKQNGTHNIVQKISTGEYFLCKNERPIGTVRIPLRMIKKENIQFKEDEKITKLLSVAYNTNFRGTIEIKLYNEEPDSTKQELEDIKIKYEKALESSKMNLGNQLKIPPNFNISLGKEENFVEFIQKSLDLFKAKKIRKNSQSITYEIDKSIIPEETKVPDNIVDSWKKYFPNED